MSNFTDFVDILDAYAKKNGVPLCSFVSNLHDTSVDTANSVYVYDSAPDLSVISLDDYVHHIYAPTRYKGDASIVDKDSPASADALLIDGEDRWFFIEFKNQKIGDTNDSVTKKAYQNYYWLLDIMYEMRSSPIYGGKSRIYNNPVDFARQYVDYVLVVSEDKNTVIHKEVMRLHRANELLRRKRRSIDF